MNTYTYIYIYYTHIFLCVSTALSHLLPVKNVPFGPRQCLRCHTGGVVFCAAQQTCLLHDKEDMSAVRHSRHVTCLLCVTQQTFLLCDTAGMSAV